MPDDSNSPETSPENSGQATPEDDFNSPESSDQAVPEDDFALSVGGDAGDVPESSDQAAPEEDSLMSLEGELPMFPLGTVLFPGQVLPLHIFEERYLKMISMCLADDKLFGVVLIERGSEVGGGEVRTNVGTVAEIVSYRLLDGQKMAVLAVGRRRLAVHKWLKDDPFPKAEVKAWPCEANSGLPDSDRFNSVTASVRRVWALRREMGANEPALPDEISQDSMGSFALSAQIPLQQFDRQKLLEAGSVSVRLELLEEILEFHEQLLLANLN